MHADTVVRDSQECDIKDRNYIIHCPLSTHLQSCPDLKKLFQYKRSYIIMGFLRNLTSALLLVVVILGQCNGVSVNKDLTLTRSEKATLDKFKERVSPKLQKDYQKSDIYLIRWLRARSFNLETAEQMLMQDLKWRKQEKIDTIHEEDWSDYERRYPFEIDGVDNEGKPILTANFDEWDLRQGVLAGERDKINRWMAKAMDEAVMKVREFQAQGKNVTQWDFIINMNNFNLVQHGCLQCLPIYVTFVSNYESHFPGSADKILLLNTPQIFEVVLNLIRPVMSQQTRDALKVYGNNKSEWENILFADISRDELPKEYGGTKQKY